MPQILPIITAIGGLLGIGTTIEGLTNKPSSMLPETQPSAPTQAQPTPAQAGATESANRAQQALIARRQLPGLESDAPGVSPDYLSTMSNELAGTFGTNPATTNPGANFLDIASSAPAGPNNLQALLQQLQGMQGLTTGASITG